MQDQAEQKLFKPERMLAFTDAVIAVAITLLVLDLKVPPLGHHASDQRLLDALRDMIPKFGMYGLSFLVVGSIWLSHHRKFSYVDLVDRKLLLINLLFLLSLGLVPFATTLVSEYSNRVATIAYAANLAITLLLSSLIGWYVDRTPKLISDRSRGVIPRETLLLPLLTAAVFALSIPVALLNSGAGRLMWLLTLPIAIISLLAGRNK